MNEREHLLTTMELCEKLSVSRSWVNTHLRHLGSAPDFIGDGSRIRSVFYREADVVKWLNDHAACHAQTKKTSLYDYAPKAQVEQLGSMIRAALEREQYPSDVIDSIVFSKLIDRFVPPDVIEAAESLDERKRGDLPWVPVRHRINALDDLRTIKSVADGASPEIGYRKAFSLGMIRFDVDGRRWFVNTMHEDLEWYKWVFLVPYPQR